MWFFKKKKKETNKSVIILPKTTNVKPRPYLIGIVGGSPLVYELLKQMKEKESDDEYVEVYISGPNPQAPQ